jgi:hypothetical protein
MLLSSFGQSGPEQAVEVLAHIVRPRKHIDSPFLELGVRVRTIPDRRRVDNTRGDALP